MALDAIHGLKADIYFMGVTAAHPVHGLTTGDMEEAATKRTIAENTAATHVLLTREKIGSASPWKIMPLAAAAVLIVPGGMEPEALAPYRDLGMEIAEA